MIAAAVGVLAAFACCPAQAPEKRNQTQAFPSARVWNVERYRLLNFAFHIGRSIDSAQPHAKRITNDKQKSEDILPTKMCASEQLWLNVCIKMLPMAKLFQC